MGQSKWRGKRVSGLLGGASVLLLSATAYADGPFVLHLEAPDDLENQDVNLDENGKPQELENGGPGCEQPTVTTLTKNGKTYVVTIWMSSMVENDPNQCKCSSVELSAEGVKIVADKELLTNNDNTDRPCNHPHAVSDGKDYVVWGYGYAENNEQTQTYVQVLDEMCKPMTEPLRISQNNNNNQGAPQLTWAGEGYISAGYYDNNDQRTYYRQLALQQGGGVSLEALGESQVVIDNTDIGRPDMGQSGDYTLLCAAQGDQRPPEVGVSCSYINSKTGQVMWANEVIAASDDAKGIYFNQPSVITLAPGRFVLQVIQSTGTGKLTNVKGGSKVHLYALQPTETGPGVKGHFSSGSLGSYQTHSALVAGGYGVDGTRRFGLLEAAITGNGVPLMSFIDYDPIAETFAPLDPSVNEWVLGPTIADSGFLANLYGNNPNDQGRDYMRGIGDVPNPGAGTEKGFMPTVKDWFVLPYAGRNKGDNKNGLYLSFLPGATVEKLEPTTPEVVGGGKGTSNPNAEPDFGQPGDPKPTGTDPGEGNGGPGTGALQPGANTGCACSTESRGEGGAGGALAAMVGLSLLALRRRKES